VRVGLEAPKGRVHVSTDVYVLMMAGASCMRSKRCACCDRVELVCAMSALMRSRQCSVATRRSCEPKELCMLSTAARIDLGALE
jgi:hypothetical protein